MAFLLQPAAPICQAARDLGLIVITAGAGDVIRLVPPLTVGYLLQVGECLRAMRADVRATWSLPCITPAAQPCSKRIECTRGWRCKCVSCCHPQVTEADIDQAVSLLKEALESSLEPLQDLQLG